MEITHEVERMKKVACPKGHGPAELPQEGNWTQVKEIRDIAVFPMALAGAPRSRAAASLP